MNPRGLFLDLDGTLADSLGVMRLAYGAFLAEHGAQGTDAEFASLNGPPLGEVVRRLARTHGLEGPEDRLLARYGAAVDRFYAEVPPHIGAAALLAAARAAGAAVAVVTSNSLARTEDWLRRTGLRPSIDLLVCGEDVRRGKPDPEPYLLALQRSGLAAADVVAVEDSAQGLAAAASAGLRTAALVPPGAGPPPGSAPTAIVARLDALVPLLFPQT